MNQPLPVTPPPVATKKRKVLSAIPAMPDYNARVLGYLVFAAILVSGILVKHFDEALVWAVPAAMLWPHILYFSLRYLNQDRSPNVRQGILMVDSFLLGAAIILIKFSVTPTLFYLLILNFCLIIIGGMRTWALGNMAFIVGMASASIYFGISLNIETPFIVSLVSGIGATIFISVTAYYTHLQARALVKAKSQIQHQREQSIALSHKMSKYLSPQVWESIFTGERDVRLETQRKKLAIFFSDIKGFTQLSDEIEPEALTDLLNNYFNEMSQIALKYGGTIDKFVGDSIMVFFGDPTSRGAKNDTLACVAMAIEMRKHMKVLRQKWRSQGIRRPLEIRMGISTGYCTVGNFGAENRMDYTIIGKEVNLASRLESHAEAGEILVSYTTFSLINDKILTRDKGEISVKGFSKPVPIFSVIDYRRDIGSNQSFIEHECEGFAMLLDQNRVSPNSRFAIIKSLEAAVEKLKDSTD